MSEHLQGEVGTTLPSRGDPSSVDGGSPEFLTEGTQIGRYIVCEPLGVGGMGVVYLGYDPDLKRKVALKLLHRDSGEQGFREQLLAEAQATARLSHANVVSVYDVGHFEGGLFIALEYVQGGTLRQWLRRERPPWKQILKVFVAAGQGLRAAHEAGLIHRDFKPDNVLIGIDGRVRVADFGLARRTELSSGAGEAIDALGHTIFVGQLAGSPGYMAPEQLREDGEVDARSDLFAFCITLWEALAGERPFGGATIAEHFQQVLAGQLRVFPRDVGLPLVVRDALMRGLLVDPEARWQSVDELVEVLAAACEEAVPGQRSSAWAESESQVQRYQLLEAYADGTLGSIYRARDRLSAQFVALQRLSLAGKSSGAGDAEADRQLAESLSQVLVRRHPNLVSVLDFDLEVGQGEERCAFVVLDLADSARPLLSAACDSPRAIKVHLVGQLLRALIYLHGRGRVGITLSHQNIVVVGDSLQLIDTDWLAGAVKDRHEPATVAADLYALGLLMVALFGGVRDVDDEGQMGALLSALGAGEVDRESSLGGPLAALVARLLANDESARPASASEVLGLLAEAGHVSLPIETVHTRESFLQGAGLVGRQREVLHLASALHASIDGHGRAIVLSGESGVGKSRLISEVAVLAQVRAAVVLRGTATRESSRLFGAWRPFFRWLAISSVLSDLEASVLRVGVPDIDLLLGRPVPSAPQLEAGAVHLRLFQVILSLLRRQPRPLVLVLEDLHWARAETLELLLAITGDLENLPVLVLGSYRQDEAPQLFAEIPDIERISLHRLDRAGIEALAVALVGEVGRRSDLIDLLMRETEGNAFFVVEVMRSLAEEAGGLLGIGDMALPEQIVGGGVERVLKRRLARLSPKTRRFLETAALSARELDLELLQAVTKTSDHDKEIAEAELVGVLDHYAGGWRFAHDGFRESLAGDLDDGRRRALHRVFAAVLEADSNRDRVEELARHFRALGLAHEELLCVARAGERVILASPRQGVELLTRAVHLAETEGAPSIDVVRWQRLIGDALYANGEMQDALVGLRSALRTLGYGWPRSTFGWVYMLLTQLVVQLLHIIRRPKAAQGERAQSLGEAGKAAARAAQIYVFTFEPLPLIAASMRAVNLAQRAGRTEARSIAFLAHAVGMMGGERLAERYFAEGRAAAESSHDISARCDFALMEAVFATNRGEFKRAVELGRSALETARESGFSLGVAQAEGILGCVAFFRGDLANFHRSYKRAVEVLHGSRGGHNRGLGWGLCWALSELGRDDEAMRQCEAILAETPKSERLHMAMLYGLRALLLSREGLFEEAVEAADETMRYANPTTVPGNTPVILSGPTEAYFAAWQDARGQPKIARGLRAKAKRQLRAVRLWARLKPIGRPLYDLLAGHFALLDGAPTRAEVLWTAALGQAEALELSLWQGQAHYYLAQYGQWQHRARHRSAAEHLLRRAGAGFRLGPLGDYQALLSSSPE